MIQTSPQRGSLAVIFLTVFIDLLGFGLVLPLLPIYAETFSQDESGFQLGLLMASFSAMQFLFAPVWGQLSDQYGRRPILMIGLAGSVVCYAIFSFATIQKSLFWLFVARFGAGISGATIPTAQAYIADTTTLQKRSKGMALIGMAFGLGFTFGPMIGYLAILTSDKEMGPMPGYIASGLSLVALVLAWFKLPESHFPTKKNPAFATGLSHRLLSAMENWKSVLAIPSIIMLLVSFFVCMFSFANFETTLSLVLKGGKNIESSFRFSDGRIFLAYTFIGLVLAGVQGGIVRRVSGKIADGTMALSGIVVQIVGFLLMLWAIHHQSVGWLFGSLTLVTSGFAFLNPSINSLISRRSHPETQGRILGVCQSVSSMARIVGSYLGIPLLTANIKNPYVVAIGLMCFGMILLSVAVKRGKDFGTESV